MKPRDFCREPGYDKALLISYDFDALFFERVVLPDLWIGGSTEIQVIADLGQVTRAVPRWVGQVRHLGQRYQLTCASVKGAFHPKMIVREGGAGAAIWIGSGNLTYGGWGCNLEIGTAWRVGPSFADKGGWLRSVLVELDSWLPKGASAGVLARIVSAGWLQGGTDDAHSPVLVSGAERPLADQLLDRWQGRRFDSAVVITGSTDEHGAVLKWLHQRFDVSSVTVLLDPSMASFDPDKLTALPFETELVKPKDGRTVHAKVYWFEGADGCAAVIGSANCSSAAWLIPPTQGGNIEALAVYDNAPRGEFAAVLTRVAPDLAEPASLVSSPQSTQDKPESGTPHPVAEVSWERLTHELTVTFTSSIPNGASVEVEFAGEHSECRRRGSGMVWSGNLAPSLVHGRGTVFGVISISLADGSKLPPQQIWLNDLAELRTSAKGRKIGDQIRSLGRWQPSSEHQKIVTELHRISTALLTDSSLFPDPLSKHTKAEKEESTEKGPENTPAADPQQLIRSLNVEDRSTEHTDGAYALHGITLTGVLRALFDFGEEEFEIGAVEDPDTPAPPGPTPEKPPPTGPPTPPNPPVPPATARAKLRKDMDQFVRKLGEAGFSSNCTVTQLVQAIAYPLAVVSNGTRGGWIEGTSGEEWTTRVFDIAFCVPYSEGAVGLIDAVRRRCEAGGELQAFRTIVGDGTLWAAMLASLSKAEWRGNNSGIRKAFALRKALLSQELLASTDTGRMGGLITNIERQSALPSVLNMAAKATSILTDLEDHLVAHWDDLLKAQVSRKAPYVPGDALFHHKGGWGFVMEQMGGTDETKIRVYRQNRAGEARVQAGFYLNVTRAADVDAKLSTCLKALELLAD